MTNDEMKPAHGKLIEAMAKKYWAADPGRADKWESLSPEERRELAARMEGALRAAAERGYFLASLPRERLSDSLLSDPDESRLLGFQDCLELIDTVRVDE